MISATFSYFEVCERIFFSTWAKLLILVFSNSVFIFSDIPVEQIRTVKLYPQSRTSNNLAKVLLKFHFEVEVDFTTDQDKLTDAIVLIWDRTFGKKEDYKFASTFWIDNELYNLDR